MKPISDNELTEGRDTVTQYLVQKRVIRNHAFIWEDTFLFFSYDAAKQKFKEKSVIDLRYSWRLVQREITQKQLKEVIRR